jgi:diguanylate cyclase (GGDEF)-like protein/PAS domain S-box-containing protein
MVGFFWSLLLNNSKTIFHLKRRKRNFHDDYISLVENFNGMAYRCLNDDLWTMKYASPKTYELLGYTEDEVVDNKLISYEEIILPKYREYLKKRWVEILLQHNDFSEEYIIKTKNNEEKWVYETGHGIYDDSGKVLYIEGYIQDITSQKQTVIRERKNQAKYRNLIENSQDAIYIDEGGIITYANQACVEFLKAPNDEAILGKKVESILSEKYVQFYKERVNRLSISHLSNPRAQYEFIRYDGSIAFAEVSSSPYFEDDRLAIHVFIHDITSTIKTESDLKRIQKRNRDLISEMKEGIGVFQVDFETMNSILVFQNKGLPINLYGKYNKIINKTFKEIFPLFSDNETSEIFNTISSGDVLHKEILMNDRVLELRFFTNVDHELVMMASDITATKKQIKEIENQASRLATMIKSTDVGTWEWNLVTNQIIVNDRWATLLGYTHAELEPYSIETWKTLTNPDDLIKSTELLQNHFDKKTDLYECQVRMKHKDGHELWILDRGCVAEWSDTGKPVLMYGIHIDVNEQIQKQKQIEKISYRDFLTGLYNRRALSEYLNKINMKNALPISIAMADVNGLKITNDSFGHSAGDELIIFVANTLTSVFGGNAFLARTGGDEFMIVKENTDLFTMHKIIDEISSRFQKSILHGMQISVAFGASSTNNSTDSLDSVVRNAEIEMYNRKMNSTIVKRSETINTILETLFEREPKERIHAQNVSLLASKTGIALNLSRDEIDMLKTLGYFHDIGKIVMEIERSTNTYNDSADVWKHSQSHSEIGYRLISSANEYKHLATDILHHHEKWDGTGYPLNLKSEDIPLRSRIITICNSYDNLITNHVINEKFSIDQAVQKLLLESGKSFDPKLLQVFIKKVIPVIRK